MRIDFRGSPEPTLGVEWELATHRWLRAGAMLNRSANAHPHSAADPSHEDYIGGSLGFAWQSGRTQTALGAFYLHGLIETYVDGVEAPDYRGQLTGMFIF